MEILRRGIKVCKFEDDTATIVEELMAVSTLSVSFSLPSFVCINKGDYIEVEGERFYVVNTASVLKQSTGKYDYKITLENEASFLSAVRFLFLDEDASTTAVYTISCEFDLCATVSEFCDMICRNMNRVFSGWTWSVEADIDNTLMNITFSGNTCLEALQTICAKYEVEWAVEDKNIRITKENKQKTDIILQYPNNLLAPIGLSSSEAKEACNRLFVYGGERNIPSSYGSTRLRMVDGLEYIQDGTIDYPVEGVKIFDDVYPHRTGYIGEVSKINGGKDDDGNTVFYWQVTDNSINFDLKSYLKDVTAKISFTGGKLVGQEFEIAGYNTATKTIEIKSQTDNYGNTIPNDSYCPSAGDSYVLLDIDMPKEYVTDAEKELKKKAEEYFQKHCQNQMQAEVEVSSAWLFENGIRLHPGLIVTLKDDDLSVNRAIRITKVERVLGGEEYGFKTKITLATFVPKSRLQTIAGKIETASRTILGNAKKAEASIKNISTDVSSINELNSWKF